MASIHRLLPTRRRPDVDLVRQVPWLRDARDRVLADLAPHADRLRLPAGRVVARAGERARELVVILAGRATLRRDGHPPLTLGAGTEIGLAEVLHGGPHAGTVIARSDLDVIVVNAPAVRGAQAAGITPDRRAAPRAAARPVGRPAPAVAGARS